MLQKWALPVFINQVLGLLFSYNMNVLVLLHVLSFDKEYPGTCILCKYYGNIWKRSFFIQLFEMEVDINGCGWPAFYRALPQRWSATFSQT